MGGRPVYETGRNRSFRSHRLVPTFSLQFPRHQRVPQHRLQRVVGASAPLAYGDVPTWPRPKRSCRTSGNVLQCQRRLRIWFGSWERPGCFRGVPFGIGFAAASWVAHRVAHVRCDACANATQFAGKNAIRGRPAEASGASQKPLTGRTSVDKAVDRMHRGETIRFRSRRPARGAWGRRPSQSRSRRGAGAPPNSPSGIPHAVPRADVTQSGRGLTLPGSRKEARPSGSSMSRVLLTR
jgi:hypothetical protein